LLAPELFLPSLPLEHAPAFELPVHPQFLVCERELAFWLRQ
jgi:hypothetical protein